jgi:hypothetical protein
MDAGRWRPGVKRRRFRNPLLLAAAVLLVGLLVTYACANGVWRAVSGAASPSLLGVVSGSVSELMHCRRTGCATILSGRPLFCMTRLPCDAVWEAHR